MTNIDTAAADLPRRAAVTTINEAHGLVQLLIGALPPADRARLEAFTAAGADCALTIKWTAHGVEVRVGVVPGDSAPEEFFAAQFPARAPLQ